MDLEKAYGVGRREKEQKEEAQRWGAKRLAGVRPGVWKMEGSTRLVTAAGLY